LERGRWRQTKRAQSLDIAGSTPATSLGQAGSNERGPGVRAEAAYRLGRRSDLDTKAALEKAMAKDSDSGVRSWARRGI